MHFEESKKNTNCLVKRVYYFWSVLVLILCHVTNSTLSVEKKINFLSLRFQTGQIEKS